MLTLYKNEWLKIRRQHIWLLIFFIPVLGACVGTFSFYSSYDLLTAGNKNEWYQLWTQMTFFYGLLLYPILTGVYAAFICRNEHLHGGWKHILAFPVSRIKLLLAKLLLLLTLLFFTQAIIVILIIIIGSLFHFEAQLPLAFFSKAFIAGWFATFPLAVIQLWISFTTKSFSIPLGVNILFTFGSLAALVIGAEVIYPWALPSLAMVPRGGGKALQSSLFFTIIVGYVLLTLLISSWRFQRKDITF